MKLRALVTFPFIASSSKLACRASPAFSMTNFASVASSTRSIPVSFFTSANNFFVPASDGENTRFISAPARFPFSPSILLSSSIVPFIFPYASFAFLYSDTSLSVATFPVFSVLSFSLREPITPLTTPSTFVFTGTERFDDLLYRMSCM